MHRNGNGNRKENGNRNGNETENVKERENGKLCRSFQRCCRRRWMAELREAFAAGVPEPQRKAAFLKRHRRRELSLGELLLTQAGYVRWWTWVLSALLFGGILGIVSGRDPSRAWMASGLTPWLALAAVAEWGRARRWGMEELELACRMPQHTALLARMAVIGLVHFVLLGTAAPMLAVLGKTGVLMAGAFLLTPYLLTAAVGMELSRRIPGQAGMLACAAAALLVCAPGLLSLPGQAALYQPRMAPLWGLALAASLAAAVYEIAQKRKETEALLWN